MFCEKCGHELNDNDLFCEKCGNRVINVGCSEETSKKKGGNTKAVIIIIAIIVLIIAAIAVVKSNDNDLEDSTVATTGVTESTEATEATEPTEVAEEIHQVGAIEELYESDEYLNEKVTVSGYVNLAGSMQDPLKMYGDYSSAEVLLQGTTGYDLPESEFMTVTGTVSKDEYGAVIIYVESFE